MLQLARHSRSELEEGSEPAPEPQLITDVEVTCGNQSDGESAQEIAERSEERAEVEVEQVSGDTAYSSMQVRKDLGKREVIAPTVKGSHKGGFSKDKFDGDVDNGQVIAAGRTYN